MNNLVSTSYIDTCTLCLQEKPIIVNYKLVDVGYTLAYYFCVWIRKQLGTSPYFDVHTCLDCFKAWENEDTTYLNMYVLKHRLLQ